MTNGEKYTLMKTKPNEQVKKLRRGLLRLVYRHRRYHARGAGLSGGGASGGPAQRLPEPKQPSCWVCTTPAAACPLVLGDPGFDALSASS